MAQFTSEEDRPSDGGNSHEYLDDDGLADSPRVPVDKNFPGSKFLESLFIFILMHENENSDGKQLSSKQRLNYFNKLKESCKISGSSLCLNDHVVRSTRVTWTSFEKNMKYCELYDEK